MIEWHSHRKETKMNRWQCKNCEHQFKNNGSHPNTCPKCGNGDDDQFGGFWPLYSERRMHRSRFTYEPYDGSSDWVHEANAAMANSMQSTFVASQMY